MKKTQLYFCGKYLKKLYKIRYSDKHCIKAICTKQLDYGAFFSAVIMCLFWSFDMAFIC